MELWSACHFHIYIRIEPCSIWSISICVYLLQTFLIASPVSTEAKGDIDSRSVYVGNVRCFLIFFDFFLWSVLCPDQISISVIIMRVFLDPFPKGVGVEELRFSKSPWQKEMIHSSSFEKAETCIRGYYRFLTL